MNLSNPGPEASIFNSTHRTSPYLEKKWMMDLKDTFWALDFYIATRHSVEGRGLRSERESPEQ